jgi:transposase
MFTYKTYMTTDYSNRNEHIEITEQALRGKTYAVLASISADEGLEYYEIHERSINTDIFIDYLKDLREVCEGEKIAIFLDNLRVHHSNKVKDFCKAHDIPLVFNLAYSPEYNPIENFFSLVKNYYKRKKQNQLVKYEKFDGIKLIQESFDCQDQIIIKSLCSKGLMKLT